MRTIDWLKSLKDLRTKALCGGTRRRVNRAMSDLSRRTQRSAEIATYELLEDRRLLSAVTDSQAGIVPDIDLQTTIDTAEVDAHADHGHSSTIGNFYLPPQHRISGGGALLSGPNDGEPLDVARSYLAEHALELGLDADDLDHFVISSQYTDDGSGVTYLYLRQTFDGLEVMNADVSISLTADGEVIHVASSFVSDAQVADRTGTEVIVNASQAFMEWSDDLGLGFQLAPQILHVDTDTPNSATVLSVDGHAIEDVSAKLVYVPTANGLELAWRLDVHDARYTHWLDAFVSAETGEAIYTDNRIGNATYNVFALPARSPIDGARSIVVDPNDPTASPYGWHDTNGVAGAEFTDTRGNNVIAQEDVNADNAGGFRPSGGASLNFDFAYDSSQSPANYQSAALSNAFYWVNLLHDIHYQYGFTEAAGNFQTNNYGRGGVGNDPVLVDIQDGDGGGDGFAALPDGQSPRMTLHSRTGPFRDSAYDSDILIHEFGHGISERLTGGPGNTTALNAVQSKGMGEGWGDWWALMLTQVSTDAKLDAYPIGNYAAGFAPNGPGIRQYPYSFDKGVDPLTYANFNGGAANNQQHKAGTIWASALWDMNWLFIDKHGFSSDLMHGNGGNNLALQLVMDGLKLQGTNPSFLAGRDAILAADVARTGGQNQTEIWNAFARRGMGFSASDGGGAGSTTVVEAFDVPANIRGTVFRDDDGNGTQNGAEPGLAGRTVYLDLNNNGVADVATTTTFNSTDTPKAIADHGITYSNRTVSGLVGSIVDINVTVNLTHPQDGDLYLTLISPSNTPVIMANYLGGSGDNYTNTTFDDEASTYISAGSAPFTGSFKPYYDLAQLDGRDPNGTWKLRMDDAVSGNVGQLLSWSLQITYGNADPVTITDANGDYTFFGVGNGTHHVREIVAPGVAQTVPASGVYDVTIVSGQSVNDRDFGNRIAATIANGTTLENTLSSAIAITPPANQGVTHFKVSGISGGTLFKNNGTTAINNGDFISVAEGLAGVRFLPTPNSTATGHFDVELSADGASVLAGSSKTSGTVAITALGGFLLNKNSISVSESGSIDTFSAVLTSQPTSNVVLSVVSSDTTETTVSAPTLTFTPANWNVPQTVTVTGVNDALDDGDIGSTITVSVVDASSDNTFDPLADQTVSVMTTDNDASGFTITQTGGSTSVTETGSTDTFSVVLTSQPTSNVVLSVTSGDTTEATVSAPTLTFTPANWNIPQTVTVTGVNDLLDDGDIASTVTLSVVDASSDNTYDPLADQTVSVTTIDNDASGFTIAQTGGSTSVTEAGTTDTFTVVLTAQPTSSVVLSVISGDTTEATVSAPTLTFTAANWNIAQTVTVTGVNDALDDGDIGSTIIISVVDASSDNSFDPLADQVVSVTTIDNDAAGFTIIQSGGTTIVTEALTVDTFTVVLTAQPMTNVVLKVTHPDSVEPDVAPSTLTFTSANWNIPQTVYVRGVDDALDDGDVISTLTIAVDDAQSNDVFDAVADQTVNVTTLDNDITAGVSITQSGGSTSVTEAATTDTFTVVLTAQPITNVAFSLVSDDTTEAVVNVLTLTFTSVDWNVPQTVTVTGVDDALDDGDIASTITLSVVDASSDDAYDTLPDQMISVTTIDNDALGLTVVQNGGTTSVTEAGSTDGFSIVLNALPSSDVVLSITSGDVGQVTVDSATLTFTPLNWNVPQVITVTGVADHINDGNQVTPVTIAIIDDLSDDLFDALIDQAVNVTVTNVNSAPSITGGAGSFNRPENATAVTTISASDPDANTTLNFILSGTDASKFTITSGGALSFKLAPNFEVDAKNYSLDVTVSDGALSDTQSVSVTIGDVNEAPAITSGAGNINVSENSIAVTTITAFDPDADAALSFTLAGADADKFQITNAGVIIFKAAPDFEGGPTSYSFEVTVSDGSLTDSRIISIGVTDVDEVAPTADIVDIAPDPRQSPVGAVLLNFSEPVTGVDIADFSLMRDGVPVSLNGLNVLGSGISYSLNLSSVTATSGSYSLALTASGSGIADVGGNALVNDASDAWTVLLSTNINVTLTGSESLRIVRNGLNVDVIRNNSVDSSYVFLAGLVQTITVVGGAGNNAIDLSGVTSASFPAITGITISGGAGNDAITGSDFADMLNGDAGNDTLVGGQGNDMLSGGLDNDVLTGGLGVDVLDAGDGTADILYESTPSDLMLKPNQLIVGNGDMTVVDSISGFEKAMLLGGGTANVIDASAATIPVSLFGGGGNDVLIGGNQADSIDGQAGNDTVTGGGGNDSLVGGVGTDQLREVAYSDFVAGQVRNITLSNGTLVVKQGVTTLSTDSLSGFEIADLTGGAMRDLINAAGFTGTGVTSLSGGGGNDVISGTSGPDLITSLTGADSINGNGGSDTVYAGSGNDTISGGDGDDNLNGQNGDDSLLGENGNDMLVGGAGIDTMLGGAGNDFLNGLADPGLFFGGDGNDTLQGNTLNDTLNGDAGDDRLYGMQGNDILNGGDGADALYGAAGNDTLAGGAGLDTLQGDVGSDSLDGGADFDRVNELLDTNITVVGLNLSSAGLGVDSVLAIERIQLVGGPGNNLFDARQAVVPVLLSGAAGNDTLLGGSKADGLEGGDGDDVVSGGAGADIIAGGNGFDYWFENADANFTVNGVTVSSSVTGAETATGIETIVLIGGIGANRLDATQATVPVVLIGGRGNDTLLGGSAADTLSGGNRNDANVLSGDGTDSLNGGIGPDVLENDPVDAKVIGAGDTTVADVFTLLPSWIDSL